MFHEHVKIGYMDGKIAVKCPRWANELVKNNLPNIRWSKSKAMWFAPLLKMTVRGVDTLAAMPGVEVTDKAKAALADYRTKVAERQGARAEGGFPSWFPFKRAPRRHQKKVLDKKWGRRSFALHHDMGTGKTFTEICYGSALRMDNQIKQMLVMVKLSGRRNWYEQFEWCPIPYDICLPYTKRVRQYRHWLNSPHDFKVLVVGLESLSEGRMHEFVRAFLDRGEGRTFGLIDESHLIANHKSIRAERVYEFRPLCSHRDTCTGTPISKAPLDLYGQFEWLDPDIIGIGDFYAFRNRYATIIEQKLKSGGKFPLVVGYQNIGELTKLLAPYTDEVRKSDVLELPPKNYLPHVYVQPTKEQEALLKKIKTEGAYSIVAAKGEQVIQNVLELELRLHQVAQGFMPEYEEEAYIGRKGDDRIRKHATWHPIIPVERNPKISELVDVARADRQFIIWATGRAVIEAIVGRLQDQYPKDSVVQIHGGVSEADRATYRQEYQKGKHKYMVGTTMAGGQSDTWTACETMIYTDNSNRLIDRLQSEDRAHRDGLTHVVDYIDLIMEKTPDVTRLKAIQSKMDLAEYVRINIRNAEALLNGE